MQTGKVRFVCVSDTHNACAGSAFQLPRGDVLIHAGDLTNQGSLSELRKAVSWIEEADFAVKIVVAGNHDLSLDQNYKLKHKDGWTVTPVDLDACRALFASTSDPRIVYLQHSDTIIQIPNTNIRFKVFGSPYSPDRGKQNWSFQYNEHEASTLWDAIPTDTDVVITHTPIQGHRDTSAHWKEGGCAALKNSLARVKPWLHVCGHCHEGRGAEVVKWHKDENPALAVSVREWEDPGNNNKKQSLLDLTGQRGGEALQHGEETAVINAAITARSFGRGPKKFNKPIVVDLAIPQDIREARSDG